MSLSITSVYGRCSLSETGMMTSSSPVLWPSSLGFCSAEYHTGHSWQKRLTYSYCSPCFTLCLPGQTCFMIKSKIMQVLACGIVVFYSASSRADQMAARKPVAEWKNQERKQMKDVLVALGYPHLLSQLASLHLFYDELMNFQRHIESY